MSARNLYTLNPPQNVISLKSTRQNLRKKCIEIIINIIEFISTVNVGILYYSDIRLLVQFLFQSL